MPRRRANAAAAAAVLMLLAGCSSSSPADVEPSPSSDDPAFGRGPIEDAAASTAITTAPGVVTVTTADSVWVVELLEVGPAPLDELVMFDDGAPAREPADGEQVAWVCVQATQLEGVAGRWLLDDVRIELGDGADGPRFDGLTGFDYQPADDAVDAYEATGNALGEPYERVCPLFVVPNDLALDTVLVVPDDGEPVVLTG